MHLKVQWYNTSWQSTHALINYRHESMCSLILLVSAEGWGAVMVTRLWQYCNWCGCESVEGLSKHVFSFLRPLAMAAYYSPNYRGLPLTSNQLMLTDSLMIEKHTPYLFTGNSNHTSYPNQAYWTLERRERGSAQHKHVRRKYVSVETWSSFI